VKWVTLNNWGGFTSEEWSGLILSQHTSNLEISGAFSQEVLGVSDLKIPQNTGFTHLVLADVGFMSSNSSGFNQDTLALVSWKSSDNHLGGFSQSVINGVTQPPSVIIRPKVTFRNATLSVDLRRPIFGDTHTLDLNFISLENIKGGNLIINKDPLVFEKLEMTFSVITNWLEFKTFLLATLGEEIYFDDMYNRTWLGCIKNESIELIFEKVNEVGIDKGFTIIFEGALI